MADITGTEFDEELIGTPADDLIEGLAGEDRIFGGAGNDTLEGGADDDRLYGGEGDDVLDGGDGDDQADYSDEDGATQGINADIGGGSVIDGYGDTDTLIGIEEIEGGSFNDTISADGVDFEVNLEGGGGDDTLLGGNEETRYEGNEGADTFIAGDGYDRIDYDGDEPEDGATQGIVADMAAGTVVDGFGDTDTLIGDFEEIEGGQLDDYISAEGVDHDVNLKGRLGDDTLIGGAGDDRFEGNAGDDSFQGGDGWDQIDYDSDEAEDGVTQGVIVDMAAGTATDGFGDTDTFSGIEQIEGGFLNDTITAEGVTHDVRIDGEGGDDTLTGGDGHDELQGGEGTDTLFGGAGDDYLETESGDDQVFGGEGDDYIRVNGSGMAFVDGGEGWDTVDFDASENDNEFTAYINLETGVTGGAEAGVAVDIDNPELFDNGQDTVANIEEVRFRGDQDAVVIGTDDRNRIEADSGDDIVYGGGGEDSFRTGAGDDTIYGGGTGNFIQAGSGNDLIYGGEVDQGAGWNILAYQWDDDWDRDLNPGNGIVVTLSGEYEGTVIDWNGDTDTFFGINAVFGTNYDDTYTGSDGQDVFIALGGEDYADGGAGDQDQISYHEYYWMETEYDGLIIDLSAGTAEDGLGNTDTILNFEQAQGAHRADTIIGTDGDNWIGDGSHVDRDDIDADDDVIMGLGGNDYIELGWGDDTVDGGTGDEDVVRLGGSLSDWTFDFSSETEFTATSQYGTKTISNVEFVQFEDTGWIAVGALEAGGTDGDDVLGDPQSTEQQDLYGFGGNDTLNGGAGDDNLYGGVGNDTLYTGGGDDDLSGGDGDDYMEASVFDGQNVQFQPGNGNDTIVAEPDTGAGLKYYDLEYGMQVDLTTGVAMDLDTGGMVKIDSFSGIAAVDATHYDDLIIGGNPDNDDYEQAILKAGNDTFYGGSGFDALEYYWDDGDSGITLDVAAGTATDTHGDTDTFSGVERISGSRYDDTITGDDGWNYFVGNEGDDVMDGGGGTSDLLNYSREENRGGNRGIMADLGAGLITDSFGDTDTVSNFEWIIGTSFDDVITAAGGTSMFLDGEDGNDTITGAGGNDEIIGGAGDDVLHGRAGNDVIWANGGADQIDGGEGEDTVRLVADQSEIAFEDLGGGDFRIGDAVVSNVEWLQFEDGILSLDDLLSGATTGADVITLTDAGLVSSAGGDDQITGSTGADEIYSGGGDDSVSGGGGDDQISDAFGNNDLSGGNGSDVIVTLSGNSTIDGGAQGDFLCGGAGEDTLSGGAGNDIVIGDFTTTFGGNDRIDGGGGNDLLSGGLGADVFVFGTGDGTDLIGKMSVDFDDPFSGTVLTGSDFVSGLDAIELQGFGYANGADALANVTEDASGNAVFSDQGTTFTLWDVSADALSADDFILV